MSVQARSVAPPLRVCATRDSIAAKRHSIFLNDPVGEWLSHEAFNLVIAGSSPVRITTHASVCYSHIYCREATHLSACLKEDA